MSSIVIPVSPSPTLPGSQSTSVAFLRQVLSRLAARGEAPDPENFARAWRELRRENGLPLPVEYVNDMSVLEHAIDAFDDLFVGDAWLRGKLGELRELLAAESSSEEIRRRQVKLLIDEIDGRKEELLYHLAESSGDIKRSLAALVDEMGLVGITLSDFQSSIERYRGLAERTRDLREARRLMSLMVDDTRRFDEALDDHRARVMRDAGVLEAAGEVMLGSLSPQHLAAAARMHGQHPAHPVSGGVLDAQTLLERLHGPGFGDAGILLVELAEPDPEPARVTAFSALCADCLEFPVLLGYWGGGQFVYVIPGAGREQALAVARTLRRGVLRDHASPPLAFRFGADAYSGLGPTAGAFFDAFEAALVGLQSMQQAPGAR
jgi:hypothetical protein